MVAGIVIVVIVVLLLIWFISISNGLNRAVVKIDEAASGIDVALQKRHDVLTKMLDVVKAYAKHEKEVLFEIVNLRKDMTMKEKSEASAAMDESFRALNVVAEAYPQLLSSENYKTLQLAIADTEEHLQAARRLYNANVSSYNQKIVTFPASVVAGMKSMARRDFFEVSEEKKADVAMDL